MYRPQSLLGHVSVQLGRRKIGVSQEFLHGTQVGPAVEQVGCVRVAQCVGVGRAGRSAVENAPDVTRREATSPLVQEERIRR